MRKFTIEHTIATVEKSSLSLQVAATEMELEGNQGLAQTHANRQIFANTNIKL